jgi:hypothetical protein
VRQHIDLAWLRREAHHGWFESTLSAIQPALNRVRMHELPWLVQGHGAGHARAGDISDVMVHDSPRVLANSVVELRRFDALLITVSIDTLAWTRRCLAALPKTPVVPIIGVLDQLQSGAMIDLLELGMADFVRPAVCAQEFRARLISAVCRTPRYIPLREPARAGLPRPVFIDPRNPRRGDPRQGHEPVDEKVGEKFAVTQLVWPNIPFQENKQRIIDLFERQYLRATLRRANGNITEAARIAHKDRRSFWELMRRHKVAADT